ncbi:hypothetical protein P171DRAFT_525494 [Karstenula rhodostoma CBS 690.94]|uniref:Uncharacterized protein n=1 Tax=Karstenula rhodostoma CBS 690.94 TaxID=1392251 RepID=A0A9P4U841_9PLEO|nr:hypothetical protein P171DRAFT_525494 [Karstenula rhodostoma CBS 690.94]
MNNPERWFTTMELQNALSTLRRTSRVCRRRCERLLFRSISLDDTSTELMLKSRGLFKRLQDPNDVLSEHVPELLLGPFDNDGYFGTFRKALRSQVASEPRSWASHMQDKKTTEVVPVDLTPRLLSSIQQLLCEPENNSSESSFGAALWNNKGYKSYNEYRMVKNCLAQGNSIKRLTIAYHGPHVFLPPDDSAGGSALLHWNRVTQGPINFDWQEWCRR